MANSHAKDASAARRHRLMIVDDSNIIRRRIERLTRADRLEIVGTACNGEEAVSLFAQLKPDIVTMDITMPKMDGIDCIAHMVKARPDVLILIISALADKATAIEAMKRGANGFLCKPFSETDLNQAFEKLLRRLAAA
jgi:two-component system, chemotaxis family, chemotaxis protein CheY